MSPPRPRVLFVLGSIPLYGMELATIEVARALRDAGCEVLFVTNLHWGDNAVNPRLDRLGLPHTGAIFFGSVERGVGLRRMLDLSRLMITENLRLARIVRRFRPTHVHLANHWDFFNLMPALALTRARLVFQAHNVPHVRHRLSAWLWRRIFAHADRFVSVSHALARDYRAIGADVARLSVIYNAAPRREATGVAPLPRRDGVLHVLYAGQIAEHKGLSCLVDALLALRDAGTPVECVLLGGDESPYARALRERAARHADAIRFVGYVDDPSPWFARADVHVAPSLREEAFGIVVAEAKTAGIPSVVSDVGALPELVRDGVDGRVVRANDAGALADALRAYADDPRRRLDHAIEARHSVARLGLDRVAQQWRDLYGAVA